MNRIDRLFAILLMLQTRKWIRARDFANKFEITERTVYRDMSALLQMGVPIISQAGEGYSLLEGYYLPPLVFTPSEARAIFLGLKMLQASSNLVEQSHNAAQKIKAALPDPTLNLAQQQAALIDFFPKPARFDLDNPRLMAIQEAIMNHRVLQIEYFSRTEATLTERYIEPLGLLYSDGAWYLNGWCRLREDFRVFRLERIESLVRTDKTFEPRSIKESPQSTIEIRIQFDRSIVRWVYERQHYGFISEESAENGDTIMRYEVHQSSEIIPWLLGWGANASILSPQSLRDEIHQELIKMLALLT